MTILTNNRSKTTYTCPKCDTQKVGRAHRFGRLDGFISLLNIYPYRCRQCPCKVRFYRFGRNSEN
jgi:ssDNA-binding Zn-finger/Zn-ribbon topoisomerase 1